MKPLRVCRGCGFQAFTKENLEFFRKHKASRYGRMNQCKVCCNAYQRANAKSGRERARWARDRKLIEDLERPVRCYFCYEGITKLEGLGRDCLVMHSLDGNHENYDSSNKVPTHSACHMRHHAYIRWASPEFVEKMRNAQRGRKHTPETIEKMRATAAMRRRDEKGRFLKRREVRAVGGVAHVWRAERLEEGGE